MATPRSQLIDPEFALHYHLVSRCVRSSWLCGRDRKTGKDYNHRKKWLKDRLLHLAQFFAIDIDAFVVMDNHFHLVVFYDPIECTRWSDEEVASRWCEAFPSKSIKDDPIESTLLKSMQRETLLAQPLRLAQCRKTLGSLSAFMKHLKQPIAWRANQEDKCKGHFFEGRFYSGALLSEDAVLAAMAYVDLNPVRAKIARNIKQCQDSSIATRLKAIINSPDRLAEALEPLVSGINEPREPLSMTLNDYCAYLTDLISQEPSHGQAGETKWFNRVASFRTRQRAYGLQADLEAWSSRRGWRRQGKPLTE